MLNGCTYNKVILDENGKVIDIITLEANSAFERIVGIPRSEILGKRATTISGLPAYKNFIRENRQVFNNMVEVALTGKSLVEEFYFVAIKKWLRHSLYSPKKYYFIALIEDITKRKELEQKIADHTKNLEKLVEERTRQLKDAEHLAAVGQTAGMIGHDIRNPLQAITNELYIIKQTLNNEAESKLKMEIMDGLVFFQEQIDYISKIVFDLQDYSRIIKPKFVNSDLPRIVSDVLKSFRFPSKYDVSVNIRQGLKLKTDPILVRRILTNLINNSIQAMPEGGKLAVSAEKKERIIIIEVSDTGKGIPEKVKPLIFKPLFTTKAKGQGLGLAVVKRLVDSLRGTITFESKKNKGTTFKIILPIKK